MYHMSHSNSNVRTLAFSMLVKHLKQRPHCWKDVMQGYIGALESGNEAVVSAALNFLPEFAVYCQVRNTKKDYIYNLLEFDCIPYVSGESRAAAYYSF